MHKLIHEHEAAGDSATAMVLAQEAYRFDSWMWIHRQNCNACEEIFMARGAGN